MPFSGASLPNSYGSAVTTSNSARPPASASCRAPRQSSSSTTHHRPRFSATGLPTLRRQRGSPRCAASSRGTSTRPKKQLRRRVARALRSDPESSVKRVNYFSVVFMLLENTPRYLYANDHAHSLVALHSRYRINAVRPALSCCIRHAWRVLVGHAAAAGGVHFIFYATSLRCTAKVTFSPLPVCRMASKSCASLSTSFSLNARSVSPIRMPAS